MVLEQPNIQVPKNYSRQNISFTKVHSKWITELNVKSHNFKIAAILEQKTQMTLGMTVTF